MIDLSIIIVSFNTKKLTLQCLESVIKNTKGIVYEIIVVDNASSDGTIKAVEKISRKTTVRLIKNRTNLGFGRANNQGIIKAKGEFVLLLNSDTIVRNNLLKDMVKWMSERPQVGVSSCALKNRDKTLQETGGYFPDLFRVCAWMFFIDDLPFVDRIIKPFHPMHTISPIYKNIAQFKKSKEVDWLTGAFLLIRRDVLDKSGLFDEDYFMYTEEVDLCYRIKKAGYKVWYLPKWSITHLGGASGTKELPILKEFEGVKLFYKKRKPSWQYPILRILLKGGAILRMIIFGVWKGVPSLKTYAKAFRIA